MQPAFPSYPAVDQPFDAIVNGDQTERQFSERLLPCVKANAYTWVRLQSEKRKHKKDHCDRLTGDDERSLRAQIDDEPVDEKRRWATRLLVKLRKDILAQDREHFVASVLREDGEPRCVRTNPDQKHKMRRIDCFRQADKVWRLDLVTTVLFRGFPLESTDGERLGRTCGNPLCIQPHHITIQVRELDLLLANFLVDGAHGGAPDGVPPPNLSVNGAYTAEELRQTYSVPLSSLQGFNRPLPPTPSIPISSFGYPRKRHTMTNDFHEMDEEMSDADSTVLGSSLTSEHSEVVSSPKIPALMGTPHRMPQYIKQETVGSPVSTSFPPRWGSAGDCMMRGGAAAQPHSYAPHSSGTGFPASMFNPQTNSFFHNQLGTNTGYSSSLPTSMHQQAHMNADLTQFPLGALHAGSPPAGGMMSAGWPGRHTRPYPQLSTLNEPRGTGFMQHHAHHPTTISPDLPPPKTNSSPPPAGLLSEEDAEELLSGGAGEDDMAHSGILGQPLIPGLPGGLGSSTHDDLTTSDLTGGLLSSAGSRWPQPL